MKKLRFTTIQAPNQDFIIGEVCAHVGAKLGLETEFVIDIPWEERAQRLDRGEIEVAWICGLPYVERMAEDHPTLELLAAPVMAAERYQNRPVYFSDVIVRKGSHYRGFGDLRGARWAFNEPHSHSGYNITRYTLARMGAGEGFFGEVVQAGSHQRSIRMVLAGEVDAAAIDTTVLEIEKAGEADLEAGLRVIDSLGPSPIPPLVIALNVSADLREEIRRVIVEMDQDEAGKRILQMGKMRRYARVSDGNYDLIREMTRVAEGVRF
jgi:phosphonate transport system substrate-binding protein